MIGMQHGREPHAAWVRRGRAVLLLVGIVLPAGCHRPPGGVRTDTLSSNVALRRMVLGKSLQDRPIECLVFGTGEDTILLFATIHGDEPAGTPLLRGLSRFLQQKPQILSGRRVILIPVANPDGYVLGTRGNARGVDLNRNFPAENYEASIDHGQAPLSEPESRVLDRVLRRYGPDRIVSIHQPRTLRPCIDYDGPSHSAASLAQVIARFSALPVTRLGSRPGSLGSYAGETLGIPIITLEIPRTSRDGDEAALWRRYGGMMLAAVCYPNHQAVADLGVWGR